MPNYGFFVFITILVTSLVSFYLLYKAKELNLGIVISISIGSIILGFSFSPAFNAILKLLSENINVNKIIALIISLLTVIVVFLLLILIVSFIISICMPKKLASIDCCLVVDRLISKMRNKYGNISIKDNLTKFLKKIASEMQYIVKNVYNSIIKLKKPVDTNQIIDTIGIEKNQNNNLKQKSIDTIDTPDSVAFANLIGFMEPSREVVCENQDSPIDANNIEQTIADNNSTYDNLEVAAYQDIVTAEISDNKINEVDENIFNNLSESIVEDQEVRREEVEDLNQILLSDENDAVEFVIDDDVADNIEYDEEIAESGNVIDDDSLVLKAFISKDAGKKEVAIEYYIEALQHEPNNEMVFWIVLDICALYKQLGLSELAKSILEGLVSEYGAVIQPEVKMEIMNSLK